MEKGYLNFKKNQIPNILIKILIIIKEWYDDGTYIWKENCECKHNKSHNLD